MQCLSCNTADVTELKSLTTLAVFYGYLVNTEFDDPVLHSYVCGSCGHGWRTLEVPVKTDPLAPGSFVGLGGQLRAATTAGGTLSRLSLSEQRSAAQDALVRQGRARRTLEDRRIDSEAEEKAAPAYLAPARRPGRNPDAPRGRKPAPPANPPPRKR